MSASFLRAGAYRGGVLALALAPLAAASAQPSEAAALPATSAPADASPQGEPTSDVPATAQSAPTPVPTPAPPAELGTVVTATRGRPIGTSAVAASVLLGREISASPVRTPDALLRTVPGVSLPRADSRVLHPTGQGVALRGIGRGRTLVLLDGLPLNDPFGGWIQWNQAAKSQLERVEVVRGASSSLYGNLAMGGVIQLFTRPVKEPRLVLEADYGNRQSPHLAVYGASPVGEEVALGASADVYRTDGYVQVAPSLRGRVDVPSAYASQNASVRGTWERGPWSAFASASYFREQRNAGTPLTDNRQWIAQGSAGAAAQLGEGRLELFGFGGQQRFHNANSRVDATRTSEVPVLGQTIPVEHAGGSLVWTQRLGDRQDLVAGVDLRWVGATNSEDVFDASGAPAGARSASGRQAVGGVFAEWSGRPWDWLTLGAGLRGDGWWNYAGRQVATSGEATALAHARDTALSPRLSAVARLAEGLALRGAAYTGFRAPNLNELYRGFFSGQVLVLPNPDLGPERLVGGEVGLDWAPVRRAQVGLTLFADRTSDRIEQVTLSPTTRQRRNIAAADSSGAELEASWRPLAGLRLYASYALARSRVARFPENPALVGKELAGLPRHSGAASVQWSDPRWVDLTARVRAESDQFADDRNELELPRYATVDLTLARKLREEVELYVSVENLFDAQVLTERTQSLERLGTPRSVWGGFRVRY